MRGLANGLLVTIVLVPILAGLVGVVLPAFGYLPALGFAEPGLAPFRRVLALPGLATSVAMSIAVGVGSTLVAIGLAVVVTASFSRRHASRWLERLAAPLIAVPHLSIAVGAAFLLAPSGWLVRLLAGPLGLEAPPALPLGAGYDLAVLTIVLVLKEAPFLIAVVATIARQVGGEQQVALARTLGYGDSEARLKLLAPAWLARTRLAVLAVLVYAIGNVELALVVGPSTPPLLPALVLDLMTHPDLARRLDGSAAAVLLTGAVAIGYLLVLGGGRLAAVLARRWRAAGPTPRLTAGLLGLGDAAGLVLLALLLATLVVLGLWSVAGPWRFSDPLPAAVQFDLWQRRGGVLAAHAGMTAVIAAAASLLALGLVLLWLETAGRPRLPAWLWLPLVVPQIAFLFGLQVLTLAIGLGPGLPAVILAHLLFVVPYVALLLTDAWAGQDPRYAALARSLGHGRWGVLFRVKLPMLRGPLALALAVGISVSTALYLPTLVAGGGRVATLATEAVSLAQGGDRRFAAATGVVLAVLPLLALLAARRLSRLTAGTRGG